MTPDAAMIETVERLAIADPGQTIILRVTDPNCTREELTEVADAARKHGEACGVHILVLGASIEVAQIKHSVAE